MYFSSVFIIFTQSISQVYLVKVFLKCIYSKYFSSAFTQCISRVEREGCKLLNGAAPEQQAPNPIKSKNKRNMCRQAARNKSAKRTKYKIQIYKYIPLPRLYSPRSG